MGVRAGDVAEGSGPVAVVLVVVGAVDRVVDAGVGRAEGDVTLDPTGADAARAAGEGVPNHGRAALGRSGRRGDLRRGRPTASCTGAASRRGDARRAGARWRR